MMQAVPIYESVVRDLGFRPAEVMKMHVSNEGGHELMIQSGNVTYYFPKAALQFQNLGSSSGPEIRWEVAEEPLDEF